MRDVTKDRPAEAVRALLDPRAAVRWAGADGGSEGPGWPLSPASPLCGVGLHLLPASWSVGGSGETAAPTAELGLGPWGYLGDSDTNNILRLGFHSSSKSRSLSQLAFFFHPSMLFLLPRPFGS